MAPTSLIVLVVFLLAIPTLGQLTPSKPTYVNYYCVPESGNYTNGSAYQQSLNTLLSSLQTKASASSFFNTSTGEGSGSVFGTYFCRRDLSLDGCSSCVQAATKQILVDCPSFKEALVYYEQCTLLFLNSSSRVDVIMGHSPYSMWYTQKNVTEPSKFQTALQDAMNRVVNGSAYGPGSEGFATAEARVSAFETLYSLAQCNPDRVGSACERCLRKALRRIDSCCIDYVDMAFFYPSCQIRYSVLAPFYIVPKTPPPAPGHGGLSTSYHSESSATTR